MLFSLMSTVAEISSTTYWRYPFSAICTSRNLTEFIVMDTSVADVKHFTGQGQISHKVRLKSFHFLSQSSILSYFI